MNLKERRGLVVSILTSYLGGIRFESELGYSVS
jgi:hypothetical protein